MSVKLTSLEGSSRWVILDHDEEDHDPRGGKRVTRRGTRVEFHNHIAEVSDDVFKLVEKHPSYTGEGGTRRTIMRWDDAIALPKDGSRIGPQVVDGALGTPTRSPVPPVPGWDEMTTKQVMEAVKGWQNAQIEAAISWELSGRRRKMVVRELTDLLLDGPASEPEAPVQTFDTPTFSRPLPEGTGL